MLPAGTLFQTPMNSLRLFLSAVLLSSAFTACAPDPAREVASAPKTPQQEFVAFLKADSRMTPAKIRNYAAKRSLRHSLRQDAWEGHDYWTIQGAGSWSADYTGRKMSVQGDSYNVPVDGAAYAASGRTPQDYAMNLYYDRISNTSTGEGIRFDRVKNRTLDDGAFLPEPKPATATKVSSFLDDVRDW